MPDVGVVARGFLYPSSNDFLLYENDHGRFVNVTKRAGLAIPLRANGCVAGDFDGDGRTDLFVTTATDDVLFWNDGDGRFTEGARKAGE